MELTILTLDFETYYDREYSLSRMTPVEYICDSRWETIGASVRLDKVTLPMAEPTTLPGNKAWFGAKARWVEGPDLPKLFERIDWSKTVLMSHNIGFDGAILAWRYGIVPALYIDTLGMVRAALPEAKGASLGKSLEAIGAPPKTHALAAALGKRLADIKADPRYYSEYKDYANRDCDGCFWLFEHLAHRFSGTAGVGKIHVLEEFVLMDAVARMTILPQMTINLDVVTKHLTKVRADKAKLLGALQKSGILDPNDPRAAKSSLMSNDQFAEILEKLGVEPPTKISMKTGKESYAFSKTDQEFMELLEDPDVLVQAVVAARLGFKSTLEETRSDRFSKIAQVCWPTESKRTVEPALSQLPPGATGRIFPPRLPFPLRYSGAHTHRLSGEWLLNLQNLGRDSELRRAIEAPPGYLIVSADASQIEARIVSWLAGCTVLVQAFDDGEDVYSTFASRVYGYAVNKKDHPTERFLGKTAVLGLGFGMGIPRFVKTVWVQSKRKVKIPIELGAKVVHTYRGDYAEIPSYWGAQENVLHLISTKQSAVLGPLIIDGPDQSVVLPNGMRLYYRNLRREVLPVPGEPGRTRVQWVFEYGRETKYIFGGKATENAVQSLARIITMNAASRIRRIVGKQERWARPLAGQIHDQLIYCVPEEIAEDFKLLVVAEMSRRLDWFATLPLDAEGGIGRNLLEVK